jgi:predicted dehydrogenase
MKVAVVGAGVMGHNHVRVLRDLGERITLVGVADGDPARGVQVSRRFGVPTYLTHTELLERHRPDAVVVAVPTVHHHSVAMDAIAMGCHVLVEKPIAATIAEAKELIDAADRAGVALAVGHIERFNPAIVELKRRLDDGGLGPIFMVHSRRQSPYPGRITDVGVIADLATHEVDMMRHLTGAEVVGTQASISQVLHPTQEDIVFGLLHFDNGVLGILDVNWVTPTKIRDISVTGERGMFTVNYLSQELFFFANAAVDVDRRESRWVLGAEFAIDEGDMIRHHVHKSEPLRDELVHFLDAVRDGTRPLVGGEDGLRALELTDEIRRNAVVAELKR